MKRFAQFVTEAPNPKKVAELQAKLHRAKEALQKAKADGHAKNALEYHERTIANTTRELDVLLHPEKKADKSQKPEGVSDKKWAIYQERLAARKAYEKSLVK